MNNETNKVKIKMIITYAKSKYAFQQTTVSWTNKMQLVSRKGGKIKAEVCSRRCFMPML